QAGRFLEPMAQHLKVHGLGTASEIFDGDPPFTPRGCIAQAWTVAEVLRAWAAVAGFKAKPAAERRVTARVPAGQKA
ncbi:MAG: amylo-alpha-1,6-glucosidase, partial [Candidatus Acidiferrales bacterium]